jgi:hypothetical protein
VHPGQPDPQAPLRRFLIALTELTEVVTEIVTIYRDQLEEDSDSS